MLLLLSTKSLKRDHRVEKCTGKIQMVMGLLTGHELNPCRELAHTPFSGVESKSRENSGVMINTV